MSVTVTNKKTSFDADTNADYSVDIGSGVASTGTQRVIQASDSPDVTALNLIEGRITACNTGAVTISSALPAGTNAIGKLAANSGVDIGDVTVDNPITNPVFTRDTASTFSQNQISVASTATLICAANANRKRLVIIQHSTTDVFVGPIGVTTSNGLLLAGTKGNQILIKSDDAIYGIVASGTQTVSYMEETV